MARDAISTGGIDMATIVEQLLQQKGRHVHTVEPSASIGYAVALMGEKGLGAVLVCQAQQVVGVLSERDCIRGVLWQKLCTSDSPVSDLMRIDFPIVGSEDTIQHCMAVMIERRSRHLPVLERGQLIGVISMGDVINGLLRDQQYVIETLESYISGSPSTRPPAH
jgi:CBS domain-containing protein